MDQLAEFNESLQAGIKRFEEFGLELEAIKAAQDEVKRIIAVMRAQADIHDWDRDRPGFQDEATAQRFCDFLKYVFTQEHEQAKALSEGVDTEGGFLVPEEFRATLLRLVETFGVARQWATVIPMRRDQLKIPRLTQTVSIFWVGEGQPKPETQPAFDQLTMVVKKMAAIVIVSVELLEDASIAIANLIGTLFAEQVAAEEDRVVFSGDVAGAGDPFNGVLYEPGVVSVPMPTGNTAFTNVTADHLAEASGSVTTSALRGARYWMHRTIWNILRTVKDVNGQYILQSPVGNQPGVLWGFPFTFVESMPDITQSAADTPFIAFGNLRHYYIGDRTRLTVQRSDHVRFIEDQVVLRAVERIALHVGIPQAFSVVRTSAT